MAGVPFSAAQPYGKGRMTFPVSLNAPRSSQTSAFSFGDLLSPIKPINKIVDRVAKSIFGDNGPQKDAAKQQKIRNKMIADILGIFEQPYGEQGVTGTLLGQQALQGASNPLSNAFAQTRYNQIGENFGRAAAGQQSNIQNALTSRGLGTSAVAPVLQAQIAARANAATTSSQNEFLNQEILRNLATFFQQQQGVNERARILGGLNEPFVNRPGFLQQLEPLAKVAGSVAPFFL